MTEHAHFHLHEPKFVAELQERWKERETERPPAPRMPPIPDLRFEYSYVRSIRPFVRITRTEVHESASKSVSVAGNDDDDASYEKVNFGSEQEEDVIASPASSVSTEVIEVQWGKVLWITTRDQVLSPLIQGALWAIASYYLTPFSSQLGRKLGGMVHARLPSKDGAGVTWLRKLFNFSSSNAPSKPSVRIRS